jgi:predicted nucleic acid-binding protein
MLVDTSVWIEHLRRGHAGLRVFLERGEVSTHPFVLGELACGDLDNRAEILRLFAELPGCVPATHDEAMRLVETHHLWGSGLGWIDIHLLAAALLAGERLLTADRRLASAAQRLGLSG